MRETGVGLDVVESTSKKLSGLGRGIADCNNLEEACRFFEADLELDGLVLLSVKFCDLEGKSPAIRPFAGYSTVISNLSIELRDKGGCPITREAIKYLAPFEVTQINPRDYNDFLSARFLAELSKMGHQHIAGIPMLVGQGLMLVTIGLGDRSFSGEFREQLIMNTCNFGILVAQRFGDVANLFQSSVLSQNQAQALFLYASGFTIKQISQTFRLGEVTVNLLLKGACKKLGARNVAEATARAIGRGEISNLYRD